MGCYSHPFSSPIFLVKMKDGSWHCCVDYRALKTLSKTDFWCLPSTNSWNISVKLHGFPNMTYNKVSTNQNAHQWYPQNRISDTPWSLRVQGNYLWPLKFPLHIPSHHEWTLSPIPPQIHRCFLRRHTHL